MKKFWLPTALAAAFLCAGWFVLHAAGSDAEERNKLIGTWEGWVVNGRGENPNAGPVRITELIITAEKISGKQAGNRDLGEGTYKLDLTQKPARLDSTGTSGEPRGKTFLGIYQLEGDTLKWCTSNPGKARPQEFMTSPGSGQFCMVLKRRKS